MAVKKAAAKRKPTAAKKTAVRKTAAKKPAARKTAAKKPAAKRATTAKKVVKKTTTRKVAAKAAPKKRATTAISDKLRKSDIFNMISENTELSKKQVSSVFEELNVLIERSIKKRGAGEFTLPGLCKIRVIKKPATKARKGINPFTGEETTFKAKPARNVVKLRALKKLKEMAE